MTQEKPTKKKAEKHAASEPVTVTVAPVVGTPIPASMTTRTDAVTLVIPYTVTDKFATSRVDVRLSYEQRRALRAIFDAVEGRERLRDGHVIRRPGEVVLWFLEKFAGEMPR